MLDKFKDLYKIQKKAREIQKELKNTEIEARSADGKIGIVFNGEQHIQRVEIAPEWLEPSRQKELEQTLQKVIAEAISRAQAIAGEKMKAIAGDLNIPGM